MSTHDGRQLLRFGFSTVVSASITIGLPFVLHEVAGLEQRFAVAISQSCAFLLNFVILRIFVFGSTRAAGRDFAYYLASAGVFRGAEYLIFLALFEFGKLYYLAALVLTLCVSTALKFVWYRHLFGQKAGRLTSVSGFDRH